MASWKTSDISTKDLELELKRRNLSFDLDEGKVIPLPLENPDFTEVCNACQKYVGDLSGNGWADADCKQYVFERAMIAVFGNKIWEWINENTNG